MELKKVSVAMLGPFPPAKGGIATNIQHILKSPLKEKYIFHNVRTMSSRYGSPEYPKERILSKLLRIVGDIFHFVTILITRSPQLIHINTSFSKWAFWRDSIYLLISKIFMKKVFFQIHGGELNEFWSKSFYITKLLLKQILKIPELITVLSSAQEKPFTEIGLGGKVKVIPNTVDLSRFREKKDFRKEFNIPYDHVVVLFIAAHFYREKGGMDLLKTIPLVTSKHKNVSFVFVGGGGEQEAMLRFCRERKIQDFVKFTGYLSSNTIMRLQVSSDIFAFPTYYSEGFPLVILEAMAAGLPVISTPIRAIPEVIEHEENGFLVKPRDHFSLAEKITWLIENEPIRKRIGQRNIKKVREKYDLGVVAKIFEQSYKEILSGDKRHEASYSKL